MRKEFATVDERHAKVQVGVVLQQKLQVNHKGKKDGTQNALLVHCVTNLLTFDHSFF